ncbi:MAG: hypothetical protein CMI73_04530 [Candidatus Pelagibacter sp.]|nr:hypothetical protein [Candidatus Pelagibacter sp.]OUV86733.1 MAG: hypothetical protein CBC96_04625 [Pelagibacteraceae bacterium TMED136]|tara:strand:+ start:4931 stop:5707 length:777 start_codon:yes stop_codon:yes gene_type:complete
MDENIQIKKLYYSPVKSFNFIEDERLNIIENRGIENDRIFAFVRNKTQDEAIKFQNKQYLRNNQSYLSIKNTPLLNYYQIVFKKNELKIYKETKELVAIKDFDFSNLQRVASQVKKNEDELKDKDIYFLYNLKIPFFDMINDNVVSLINLSSLRDFEARSGLKIDHERFRANIVIDGLPAMKELELAKKKIKIGSVVFDIFCNTPRCRATNFPYRSKVLDINLPQKLNQIYNHIDFGIYLKPITTGQIFLNDRVILND